MFIVVLENNVWLEFGMVIVNEEVKDVLFVSFIFGLLVNGSVLCYLCDVWFGMSLCIFLWMLVIQGILDLNIVYVGVKEYVVMFGRLGFVMFYMVDCGVYLLVLVVFCCFVVVVDSFIEGVVISECCVEFVLE